MYNDVYVKTLQKGKDGAVWYNGTVSDAITTDDPYSYKTATDSSGRIIFAATGDYLFDTENNTFYIWTGSKWKFVSSIGTGDQLADSAVTTAKIRNGAVTTAKLDDEAVTTAKLDDETVTTAKLDDEAVTTAKLDDEAVTTAKLDDEAVTTAKLDDEAVTTAKLDDEAVTTAKLENRAVTTAKLYNGAVTTEKMNNGSVTLEKLYLDDGSVDLHYLNDYDIPLLFFDLDIICHEKPNRIAEYYANLFLGTTNISNVGNGTVKGAIKSLYNLVNSPNTICHNSIGRGISLGMSVTPEQWDAIADGSFDNMYIGDYWYINGIKYYIAAFDFYRKRTPSAPHHVVIVPSSVFAVETPMHTSESVSNGYIGTTMYTDTLFSTASGSIKSTIYSAFGHTTNTPHIWSHPTILSSANSGATVTGTTIASVNILPLTAAQLTGASVETISADPRYSTDDNSQLPLFMYFPEAQNIGNNYWLRDVMQNNSFAIMESTGLLGRRKCISTECGVRPVFCIYSTSEESS